MRRRTSSSGDLSARKDRTASRNATCSGLNVRGMRSPGPTQHCSLRPGYDGPNSPAIADRGRLSAKVGWNTVVLLRAATSSRTEGGTVSLPADAPPQSPPPQSPPPQGPLPPAGIRALGLTDGPGQMCGRLLSALGADVLLAESPG